MNSSPHNPFDYDVLVVGAGPSGLTTAVALTRLGVRVLVVERHPGPSIFPKAIGVRPRSMEIFRSWGLEPEIRRRSQRAVIAMSFSPTLAEPRQLVGLGFPPPEVVAAVSPTTVAVCGQDQLEVVLADALRARGGEVRFGTELTDLTQTADAVRATLRVRDSGDSTQVSARYLVGADGGRSTVRSMIGVPFETLGSEGHHLGVLFTGDLSPVMPDPPPVLNVVVTPGIEGMFVSTALDGRWVYDLSWHPEAGEQVEDWTPERLTARIRAAAGLPHLELDIVARFPWEFGAEVAQQFRRGRVFLVGDAAHRTTPRGTTGMNTGIADAHNLGWKLAWVVRGWGAAGLLDSYGAEREPVGRANAMASLVPTGGPPTGDPLATDFGVEYASTAIVGGGTLAGHRAPHAWVAYAGERVSTVDLLDGRLTVLTGPDGVAWRSAVGDLAGSGMPIRTLSVGSELTDLDGELVARYGLTGSGCALVRPDGYVAWAAETADGDAAERLQQAVRLVTGHRVAELVG